MFCLVVKVTSSSSHKYEVGPDDLTFCIVLLLETG